MVGTRAKTTLFARRVNWLRAWTLPKSLAHWGPQANFGQ